MKGKPTAADSKKVSRSQLIDLLNEDLAREYQAIIAYVVYSQVIKGAAYMNIAAELAVHATEELSHALILANQIDYLGGMPVVVPKAGEDLREIHRYAAVRSGQRDRNDTELSPAN